MNSTKNEDEIHELNYDLIKRAVSGEPEALEQVLRIYEPYHNSLVTRERIGADGSIYNEIDEDKKIQLQMHFIAAIQKWRKLI
ncbi:helix-turn-helix domain-containing protein [[Clostridium] innocuum]|nr:helix-turn-helix domain-containing protein [[Clostridium] innocuum]MCR0502959.1 helix-turn-helix domain-containing protein [[Clostridium] innocuum]